MSVLLLTRFTSASSSAAAASSRRARSSVVSAVLFCYRHRLRLPHLSPACPPVTPQLAPRAARFPVALRKCLQVHSSPPPGCADSTRQPSAAPPRTPSCLYCAPISLSMARSCALQPPLGVLCGFLRLFQCVTMGGQLGNQPCPDVHAARLPVDALVLIVTPARIPHSLFGYYSELFAPSTARLSSCPAAARCSRSSCAR